MCKFLQLRCGLVVADYIFANLIGVVWIRRI